MKKRRRVFLLLLFCMCTLMGSLVFAHEDNEIEKRVNKAVSLGLQDWIDDEGYLVESFYEGKSDAYLSEAGLDGLIRTMSDEEVEAYAMNLKLGISTFAVTYYKKISQRNPDTGKTLYTGIFEVEGNMAFCMERSKPTPAVGSPTSPPVEVTNEDVRKVMYYGFYGPGDKGYTAAETALSVAEANGDGDNSLGRNILAEIKTYPETPANFKVWKVETNNGTTQDLAYATIVETGTAQIQKVSSNEAVTKNNASYSLEGATFVIYSDATCSTEVGRVLTGADGTSNELSLSPGTYYVKELVAPRGFKRDDKIREMVVQSNNSILLTVENEPISIVPDVLLQKVDSETGCNEPQGKGTLGGAEFLVEFYDGIYENRETIEEQQKVPCRQWRFRTDEDGKVRFREAYLASGDIFWRNNVNEIILPLGTLLIREVISSEGYRVNHDVYLVKLQNIDALKEPVIVSEEIIQLELKKYQSENKEALPGATFEYVSPDGTVEQFVTDEDGRIVWKGLRRGRHTLREVSAPKGYYLNQNVISFEVTHENEIIVVSQADERLGKVETILDERGNLIVEMEDKAGYKLPETGSVWNAWMACLGGFVLWGSYYLTKRRN